MKAFVRAAALLLLGTLLISLASCFSTKPNKDVVAMVNGKKILRSELDKYYGNQTAEAPQVPSGEQAASLRLSILKELIDDEIMMQRGEKLGLIATDEEVDGKISELKAPYTEEQFLKRLQDRKITLDDLKREVRSNLTVNKVMNKEVTSRISITDADINNYYNQHKAEFNLVEPQYHLSRIVVTTQPNAQIHNQRNDKAQNDAQAKSKIQQLLNRLDSGEDFSNVAMNYSEDPDTSSNGGDMGFLPESSLKSTDPAIRDAVMRLAAGHNSSVISLTFPGTHQTAEYIIVKLIAKEPAGQRDLNDPRVQQSIREQLRQTREQLLKAAYYEMVRNEARVTNYLAQDIFKDAAQK